MLNEMWQNFARTQSILNTKIDLIVLFTITMQRFRSGANAKLVKLSFIL